MSIVTVFSYSDYGSVSVYLLFWSVWHRDMTCWAFPMSPACFSGLPGIGIGLVEAFPMPLSYFSGLPGIGIGLVGAFPMPPACFSGPPGIGMKLAMAISMLWNLDSTGKSNEIEL